MTINIQKCKDVFEASTQGEWCTGERCVYTKEKGEVGYASISIKDAVFIAYAHNNWLALVEEVEELRKYKQYRLELDAAHKAKLDYITKSKGMI